MYLCLIVHLFFFSNNRRCSQIVRTNARSSGRGRDLSGRGCDESADLEARLAEAERNGPLAEHTPERHKGGVHATLQQPQEETEPRARTTARGGRQRRQHPGDRAEPRQHSAVNKAAVAPTAVRGDGRPRSGPQGERGVSGSPGRQLIVV